MVFFMLFEACYVACHSKAFTEIHVYAKQQIKREFVPRDQVSPYFPLFSVYSLLLLHKNKSVLCQL